MSSVPGSCGEVTLRSFVAFPHYFFRFRQLLKEQYLARKVFYFPSEKFALPSAEVPR